jgi:hypothetical protein
MVMDPVRMVLWGLQNIMELLTKLYLHKFLRLVKSMAGKAKKSVKPKTVKKSSDKPMTREEQLADVTKRAKAILEGADPGYHVT